MYSLLLLGFLSTAAVAAPPAKCNRDNCLRNLVDARYSASASAFCSTYTTAVLTASSAIPTYLGGCSGLPSRVSSACYCVVTAESTLISTTSSASPSPTTTSPVVIITTSSPSPTTTSSPNPITTSSPSPTTTSQDVITTSPEVCPPDETDISSPSPIPTTTSSPPLSTSSQDVTTTSPEVCPPDETDSPTPTMTSSSPLSSTSQDVTTTSPEVCPPDETDISSTSSTPTTTSQAPITTTTSQAPLTTTTQAPISTTSAAPASPCTATEYTQIAPAVAACTNIVLRDIFAPTNSSIDLSKLLPNSIVTFEGLTTFAFTNRSSFDPIIVAGKNVTIQGAPGHLIEGNGHAYWDGIGSNGGVPKPNHFVAVSKFTSGSTFQNLNIKNYPVHCFSISGAQDAIFRNIHLDNTEGNAPNNRSNGLPASHNSDGFDMSSSTNSIITNSTVLNQDDCVAVTSGNNITVSNMYCDGGHGISIGSVGGKSNNNVTNILFTDIIVLNSTNGPRIKSNFNTTGFISNITYKNIALSNIETYGIDIQQDYLNGGPTGSPSNGVTIQNLLFQNVTGTATSTARNYYVLCGDGSCSNFVYDNVHIVGGGVDSACNFPASGCPS